MTLIVNCECGERIRTATEDEFVAAVERYVAPDDPELAGKVSRDDILAMAEEV